jgi:hypothetical protein
MSSKTFESEIWKSVVGYEGRYEVSNLGRVKSLPNQRRSTAIILKQTKRKDRRMSLQLTDTGSDGKWRQTLFQVQWLVAAAFIGPRPDGMEVCHNDDIPYNNRLDNLRYDTRLGNAADRVKHDLANRGEKNGKATFTEEQVKEIKKRLATGEGTSAIARDYGVTHGAIGHIKGGRRWSHV